MAMSFGGHLAKNVPDLGSVGSAWLEACWFGERKRENGVVFSAKSVCW